MTSVPPLDERYLTWLYSKVSVLRNTNPARSHWSLLTKLYKMEFTWFVPNDDNRVEDGKDLREEFILDTRAERDQLWLEDGCSVLEMLVALSRRAEFESSIEAYWWFWRILDNINLGIYVDENYDEEVDSVVEDVFRQVIDRRYRRDGVGGLFPLAHPRQDQRKVEIRYQMAAYILENGYV